MEKEKKLEALYDALIEQGVRKARKRVQFEVDTIFGSVDFNGKNVLDIGGGTGLFSYYAACMGAEKVVCLEPEDHGGFVGMSTRFHRLGEMLSYQNVELQPVTFQEYDPGTDRFDIIIMHDSINHLDEPACIKLLHDSAAKEAYHKIFRKIHDISNSGALLVACDCSRYNFFGLLKLRNPFAPSIDWNLHQAPDVWAKHLMGAGFAQPQITWTSFNRLSWPGKLLLGNKIMAYFFSSHFCLKMNRP
jgi:SAM-dependent methyltransferase